MIRILLPVAVIAVLLFFPIFTDQVSGSDLGTGEVTYTGSSYVGQTVNCWVRGDFSLADECAPKGGAKGLAIFIAVFISAIAAILGVLGLLPFIGRLVSAVTTFAGVLIIGAIAYFVFLQMGSEEGLEGVQWGSYVAGGGGLLTLISGLSGMRGR